MPIVRVKGFKIYSDRIGKLRCYHRKTGAAIDLGRFRLGSAEFFGECARIAGLTKAVSPRTGTLGGLISAYRAHATFTDLAPKTRQDYERIFKYLKPIADTPLTRFD